MDESAMGPITTDDEFSETTWNTRDVNQGGRVMDNIRKVLDDHILWLAGLGGECADLSGTDLSNANLIGANLSDTNLRGAHLSHANLIGANLRGVDLSNADLYSTNLSDANLIGADLSGIDLSHTNLSGAIIDHATIGVTMACPETGSFHAWKKCKDNVLVKLLIPADARRSSATTRKCRADKVEVLEVLGADVGVSERGQIYEIGEIVVAEIGRAHV